MLAEVEIGAATLKSNLTLFNAVEDIHALQPYSTWRDILFYTSSRKDIHNKNHCSNVCNSKNKKLTGKKKETLKQQEQSKYNLTEMN